MPTTSDERSPVPRATSAAPSAHSEDAGLKGAEAGSRESSLGVVESALAPIAPARNAEPQPVEHSDAIERAAEPAHSWLPRDGESGVFASGWAAGDEPGSGHVEGDAATALDVPGPASPSHAPGGESANTADPDSVQHPNTASGHVEAGGEAIDYLADRNVLEFALWQRGCAFRRSMLGFSRLQCSLKDPCEDCGEHEGAHVPPGFWESVSRDTLEARLHEYRFSSDRTLPTWRPSRLVNVEVPRVKFTPPPDPPYPDWLRDTTPEPPIFHTPPPPPHDGPSDRE